MPAATPLPITPPPGVVKTESSRVRQGRYIDSLGIRFVSGRPQKRGGWVVAVTTATSGVPRAIHAWRDNSFNNYLAAGTYRKLYVYDTGWAQNDITPYRSTGTLANNPFATVSGSATVTTTHTAHGLSAGDTAIFTGSAAVGGITPNGTFVVATVVDADHYTFPFTSNATSTVAAGGGAAVAFSYEIPVGTELGTYGLGWGVSSWGLGTWGSAHSSSTIFIEPRIWALDHFGQLLLASYNGGSIYTFDPTAAQPWGRAQIIAAAPTDTRSMFVTPERFVFALRAGMVVAWCTQGDYTTWTPASGNTANTRTLTEGTKLVGGRVLQPFQTLVWSDAALYLFQWTGDTYVYRSALAGKNCGLIAPGAAITVDGVAYWMGPNSFWMYNGTVQRMPNVEDIRKFVFDQLDVQTIYQATAVYNPVHNQIEFFYTVTGGTSPSLSVTYDIATQCWWPDTLGRTSGTHFTQGDTRPYLGSADGYIYQHENTNNANGAILPWEISLAPYALAESMYNMRVDGYEFDFRDQVGNITITASAYDHLQDAAVMDSESYTYTTSTGHTDARVEGRFLSLDFSCSVLGSYMRMGRPVAWVSPKGRRR